MTKIKEKYNNSIKKFTQSKKQKITIQKIQKNNKKRDKKKIQVNKNRPNFSK